MIVCGKCKTVIEIESCRVVLELWEYDPIVSHLKDPSSQAIYLENKSIPILISFRNRREDLCKECRIKLLKEFDILAKEFGLC